MNLNYLLASVVIDYSYHGLRSQMVVHTICNSWISIFRHHKDSLTMSNGKQHVRHDNDTDTRYHSSSISMGYMNRLICVLYSRLTSVCHPPLHLPLNADYPDVTNKPEHTTFRYHWEGRSQRSTTNQHNKFVGPTAWRMVYVRTIKLTFSFVFSLSLSLFRDGRNRSYYRHEHASPDD